jgi:hypothetical protein
MVSELRSEFRGHRVKASSGIFFARSQGRFMGILRERCVKVSGLPESANLIIA